MHAATCTVLICTHSGWTLSCAFSVSNSPLLWHPPDWTESQESSSNQHPGRSNATRSDDDGFFDDSDGLDYAANRTAKPSCSNEEYM